MGKAAESATKTAVDAAHTVYDTIADAAESFADLVTNFFDIKPTVQFSTPELDGGIDGWKLKVSLYVGVSNLLGDVSKEISVSVAFSVEDMGDAIAEAILAAFDPLVDAFRGLH